MTSRNTVTDEDVEKAIERMRKRAGSNDLHNMIKAHMQERVDAFYWYGKIRDILFQPILLILFVLTGFTAALCFFYFVIVTMPPVYASIACAIALVVMLVIVKVLE